MGAGRTNSPRLGLGLSLGEAITLDFRSAEHMAWEQSLVELARAGDQRAWRELYRRFAPPLYSQIVLPRCGDRDAAADAVASAFHRAWDRLHTFVHQDKSIWFWLVPIAKHALYDAFRHAERQHRVAETATRLLGPLVDERNAWTAVELAADALILRRRVAQTLQVIHPRYARAIELRFLEERSREACASALEVKLGTFDVVLLRALRAFRMAWEATAEPDGDAVAGP